MRIKSATIRILRVIRVPIKLRDFEETLLRNYESYEITQHLKATEIFVKPQGIALD